MSLQNRFALSLAIALSLAGPGTAQDTDAEVLAANPRIGPALSQLVHGIYCAEHPERREPAPETASGAINIVPGIPDFRFRQTLVPAEIGIGFGVLAWAQPGDLLAPVIVTVTHPPYPGTDITTERWVTDVDDNANLMGFSFDSASELVLGEWTFSATTQGGEELFFVAFEVVDPEVLPQVISACFGSFMS